MTYQKGMYYTAEEPEKPEGPQVGDKAKVERWNGSVWEEWVGVWDGARYVRESEPQGW